MTHTAEQIIADINAYMTRVGGANADWYVGIATDARSRLFDDHNVAEQGERWIFRRAASAQAARAVEKAYLDAGCHGGPGGGDDDTDYVYAYLKTSTTNP